MDPWIDSIALSSLPSLTLLVPIFKSLFKRVTNKKQHFAPDIAIKYQVMPLVCLILQLASSDTSTISCQETDHFCSCLFRHNFSQYSASQPVIWECSILGLRTVLDAWPLCQFKKMSFPPRRGLLFGNVILVQDISIEKAKIQAVKTWPKR